MSTPTITIQFTPEAQAVLLRFQNLPKTVLQTIARVVDQQNQLTVADIQRTHLSYPKHGPVIPMGLRVQSNRLRNSIRASKCVITGNSITGGIGSNVKYAGVHEFGYSGTVNVRAHTRKVLVGTATRYVTSAAGRKYKKKIAVHGTDQVKAHTRKVNFPARRFILRGIAASMDAYGVRVSQAIVNHASGGAP